MSFNRFYVISPLALVALSACRSPYANSVNGVISKGPLNNALVFLDLDGDNVLDSNELSVRTDANGNFSINSTATSYKIVALTDDSTVDASSGATLSGIMLTAPMGAGVVSPTSTLMAEGGLTADEVAEVLLARGLVVVETDLDVRRHIGVVADVVVRDDLLPGANLLAGVAAAASIRQVAPLLADARRRRQSPLALGRNGQAPPVVVGRSRAKGIDGLDVRGEIRAHEVVRVALELGRHVCGEECHVGDARRGDGRA